MTPRNERPTPETDTAWADKEQNILVHARTLERSLAERTEERDELVERFRKEIKQRQETQRANAFIDAEILATRTAQRDTALAKLAKCREALESIARYDKDSKHGDGICPYGCDTPSIARQTLEETK
jgi:hypothetical protein